MDVKARMTELVETLNKARYAYYQTSEEIMSNYEYDALYDELERLEKESGIILPSSPTQEVGYEVVSALPKVRHALPMKSLNKTKDIEELAAFLGNRRGMLSWKLDGLTIVLTYEEGKLIQAATRGNGEIGEVITSNARVFGGVPKEIDYPGHLVVRGEALISYKDFEAINASLDENERYKNPRNLCSGSVRQLDSRIAAKRHVQVIAYTLVECDRNEADFEDSKENQLKWLAQLGFTPVEYKMVTGETVAEAEKAFADSVESMPFPVDGLVLTMDSIAESRAQGATAKFPRDSMAFKWQDETAETTLLSIEWSPSRTGLINPVAIFEPVELEGTTVQRASVHNVSIMRELKLGIGDRIKVYKANMIIPQISENLTQSGPAPVPTACPRCGGETAVIERDGVEVLNCLNRACPAKLIKALEHFVSRKAMNIEGLSEATLVRMSDQGWVDSFADLYRLKDHREEIIGMEGFGQASADKLIKAIDNSKNTELYRVLGGIGIPGIGDATARDLADAFHQDLDAVMAADEQTLSAVEGIGDVLAGEIVRFFKQEDNKRMIEDLRQYLTIAAEEVTEGEEKRLAGETFVITGSLNHFENRDALKELLIRQGAKVASAVSSQTTYLINNDATSNSSKNKKAKALGIPILTEDELLQRLHD